MEWVLERLEKIERVEKRRGVQDVHAMKETRRKHRDG
jgi:hypothetical protein